MRGRSRRDILGHHARTGTPVLSPPWQLVLTLTQRDIRINDLKRRCGGTAQPCRCHCGRAAVRNRAVAAHRIIGPCEPSHSAIQRNKNIAKVTPSSEARDLYFVRELKPKPDKQIQLQRLCMVAGRRTPFSC